MKNRYHPLIKLKLFLGVLSEQETSLINTRTFYAWHHIDQNQLTGYNPNDPLINQKEIFAFLHDQKHVRSMLKVYMTLFACFRNILRSVRGLNKILRIQKTILIDIYTLCKEYISCLDFKMLTGISAKKILRWQNEICSNSFLLCSKQNPYQLSLEEQHTIVQDLQNHENNHLFICDIWPNFCVRGNSPANSPRFISSHVL